MKPNFLKTGYYKSNFKVLAENGFELTNDSAAIIIEKLVEDNATAVKVKFRGSPTLLLNGEDFENLPEPFQPNLTCRIYCKGMPSLEEIKEKIQSKINRNIN
ncbi:MAG: hypothetical protein GY936_16895 [Ignavibacteriae bacterium]|nr:hypothetical protein [Ignavibacteriota bacterium]